MGMLEGQVQFVIGGDTHRDTHTAAVCDPAGAVLVHATVATSTAGHRQLLGGAPRHGWGAGGGGGGGAPATSAAVLAAVAAPRRAGGRGRAPQAAAPTQRRQERCAG